MLYSGCPCLTSGTAIFVTWYRRLVNNMGIFAICIDNLQLIRAVKDLHILINILLPFFSNWWSGRPYDHIKLTLVAINGLFFQYLTTGALLEILLVLHRSYFTAERQRYFISVRHNGIINILVEVYECFTLSEMIKLVNHWLWSHITYTFTSILPAVTILYMQIYGEIIKQASLVRRKSCYITKYTLF